MALKAKAVKRAVAKASNFAKAGEEMENKNFIKVLNQDKAQELINLGFKYTTETMNGKTIHSFFMSEELRNYINSNFSKQDFLLSNKLTF